MNQQENKPPAQVVNWPLITCHLISFPVELVLHDWRTQGIRSVSPRAAGALFIMFLFVAFHPDQNCWPLGGLMAVVFVLSVMARISAMVRMWRGEMCHSRYTGSPYLLWLFPRWSEVTIKRLEPFAAWGAGGIIYHFNHPLGSFLIASAVGLAIKVGIDFRTLWTRHLDMQDALMNHQISADDVRRGQRR